jgi:flavin-dependent dehydrogenase
MVEAEVIIVGGGPAGSTCAWKLNGAGIRTLVLDKQPFPRSKPCAGWITPRVARDLELDLKSYPHTISEFNRLYFHFRGRTIPLPTRQYAIRRTEFDHFLLQRADVPIHHHSVSHIRTEGGFFIIDDAYRCRYLVGAGGTPCPVYHSIFREVNPRAHDSQITAMEDEFQFEATERGCHLWFFDKKLSGYSWYVPKGKECVNVGVGGNAAVMKERGQSIVQHWENLVKKLSDIGFVRGHQFQPRAYTYYLRRKVGRVHQNNAFIVGDAAGLATRDMGEGIGPAVRSGILAAEAILRGKQCTFDSISKYSLPALLFPGQNRPNVSRITG